MMESFMKKIILLGIFCTIISSCGSEKEASNEELLLDMADSMAVPHKKIGDEVIGDLIKAIPSPLEISFLIKETNKHYDVSLLNDAANQSTYTSNFSKALNLGVYGTDLGYISLYNHTADAISYITALRDLSDQLGIGQFYNFEQIKRLALNANNIDSLLYLTTRNFEDINNYLYEKKRSEQSVLILTGGWLEALHLSCKIAGKTNNKALMDRVAEQKVTFEQIYLMLDNYNYDPKINALVDRLGPLKAVFNKVSITYEVKEQKVKEVNGVLTFESESESTVHYTEDDIYEITKNVENIRNSVIK
ncbi:MAG: hypothetical protein JWM14_373 [Chitinophagaceae bacterium]|nr:hypothetical protein [Chitinophagaceae bacterium]